MGFCPALGMPCPGGALPCGHPAWYLLYISEVIKVLGSGLVGPLASWGRAETGLCALQRRGLQGRGDACCCRVDQGG